MSQIIAMYKPVLSIDNPNKMKNRNNVTNLLRKELKYMLNFLLYIHLKIISLEVIF